MSSTLQASVFMGKEYSDNLHSIKNTRKNLTLKQMFEISEKLIVEQSDDIFGVSQISCENSQWKQLSLVNDEEVISPSHAKVYVFSDSVLCLGNVNQNPTSNTVWEEQLGWFKDSSHTELWTQLTENRWNSSGIFPRIHYIAALPRSLKVHEQNGRTQINSKDELSSCRFSMTSYEELKTMNRNVLLMPHLCLCLQKDVQQDVGHSSDMDEKRSGILLTTTDNKEN